MSMPSLYQRTAGSECPECSPLSKVFHRNVAFGTGHGRSSAEPALRPGGRVLCVREKVINLGEVCDGVRVLECVRVRDGALG